MKGVLLEELSRAFHNRRLWIIPGLALLNFVIGQYRAPMLMDLSQAVHPVNRLILNLKYGEFGLIAALLATLPFVDSFLDDRKQGFLYFIALRTPYRRYLSAKTLAVGLSGGMGVLAGTLAIFLAGLVVGGGLNATGYVSGSALNPTFPYGPLGELYTLSPWLYLLYLQASVFLFGAVYALMGLAVSSLIANRYVALAAPLVFVQVVGFLEERSLHLTPGWNPLFSLLPFSGFEGFGFGNQLAQFGLVLAAALGCLVVFGRKARIV